LANSDTPFGLKPVKHLNGNPWNGRFRIYYHHASDGTAIYKGDVVQPDEGNGADTLGLYPAVKQTAAAQVDNVGVAIGFANTPQLAADVTNLNRKFCPASTAMYVAVVDDPDVIYHAQESGAMTVADIHGNADIAVGTGDTATGLSGMEINSSGTSTGAATLRILRLADTFSQPNDLGTNAIWEVLLNEHAYKIEAGT
jgi:hypothetical protein